MSIFRPFYKAVSLLVVLSFLFTNNVYGLRPALRYSDTFGEERELVEKSVVDEAKLLAAIKKTAESIAIRVYAYEDATKSPSGVIGVILNDAGESSGMSVLCTRNGKPAGETLCVVDDSGHILPESRLVRNKILEHTGRSEMGKLQIEPDPEGKKPINELVEVALLQAAGLSATAVAKEPDSTKQSDDYGDTGTFTQDYRNAFFGLETVKTFLGKEGVIARDLDAGLLNRPGAKWYFWGGEELSCFVKAAKGIERTTFIPTDGSGEKIEGYFDEKGIVRAGDPDEKEITSDNREEQELKEFFVRNGIAYPCYVIVSIPGSPLVKNSPGLYSSPFLTEEDISFKISEDEETHVTRLANMPVLPLGLIRKHPSLAIAKMEHERAVFDKKLKQLEAKKPILPIFRKGDEQHRAGLAAELASLDVAIANLILERLDLKELIDDIHSPIYTNEDKYFKAVIIGELLIDLAERMPDLKQAIRAIALEYLNPEKGLSVPERLAMNLVLNKVGNEKDKATSVEEILKTATSEDSKWDNVTVTLKLLLKFDIPETMKDEVSTRIAELLFKGEGHTFYEYCPPILEKTGLSEEALKRYILGDDFSPVYHIMTKSPNVRMIPTLKMLAKFASKDRRIFDRIKSEDRNRSYNPYAYAIFLSNMRFDVRVNKELGNLWVINSAGDRVLGKMYEIYHFVGATKADAKRWPTERRKIEEFCKIHLDDMLYELEKDPMSSDNTYYLLMCNEIIRRLEESQIGIDYKMADRFINYLDSVASDSKIAFTYDNAVYRFAAKATNIIASIARLYRTPDRREKMARILRTFLCASDTESRRIVWETIAVVGISDEDLLRDMLTAKDLDNARFRFILSEILSSHYRKQLMSNLERRLGDTNLADLREAKSAVERELARKSFGIKGDDYSPSLYSIDIEIEEKRRLLFRAESLLSMLQEPSQVNNPGGMIGTETEIEGQKDIIRKTEKDLRNLIRRRNRIANWNTRLSRLGHGIEDLVHRIYRRARDI